MHLVRYTEAEDPAPHLGVLDEDGVRRLPLAGMAELLRRPLSEIRGLVGGRGGPARPLQQVKLLVPADGAMEVWAAGVTYDRSRQARMEESHEADVYDRVYEAERPELFFKALPWRVVTGGEPIAIRRDSALNVPEPELAVVANAGGEIVGYAVCNDVSSRSIEGENPLYLPQAKVYAGSCALSGGVRPAWELDATALGIAIEVRRGGGVAWGGQTTTAALRRSPGELVAYLFEELSFPDGVVLSTGTGVVPDLDFSLASGDEVVITVTGVGTLSNRVVAGKEHFAWLVPDASGARAPEPGGQGSLQK